MLSKLVSRTINKARRRTMSPAVSPSFVGAIDQGTTSTRFLIFNTSGEVVALHQIEFNQIYPQPG